MLRINSAVLAKWGSANISHFLFESNTLLLHIYPMVISSKWYDIVVCRSFLISSSELRHNDNQSDPGILELPRTNRLTHLIRKKNHFNGELILSHFIWEIGKNCNVRNATSNQNYITLHVFAKFGKSESLADNRRKAKRRSARSIAHC